jgi:hypothetical protein
MFVGWNESSGGWEPPMAKTRAKLGVTRSRSAFAAFLVFGATSAVATAADLSKYRNFEFGTDLPAVARQVGASPSEAKVIQSRPALIQELEWHPQPLGPSSQTESAKDVVLGFYDGELYRIVIDYDRYETAGLTPDDIVEAISRTFGAPAKPVALPKSSQAPSGEQEEVLARWQDPKYSFDLFRSSYMPSFTLVGVLKRLEGPAQASILEAKRLDDQEAPQRDAARLASQEEAAKNELDKARLVNKQKFRP